MRMPARVGQVLAVISTVILWSGTAFADCNGNGVDSGDETTNAGAGSSFQVVKWSLSQQRVRLRAVTDSGMDTDNCHDAAFDWITSEGHYDGRVVRNCKPGTSLQSDPNGDGWFTEPADWGGRDVNGIRAGGGFVYVEQTESYAQSRYVPQSVVGCAFLARPLSSQNPPMFYRFTWRTGSGVLHEHGGGDVADPND